MSLLPLSFGFVLSWDFVDIERDDLLYVMVWHVVWAFASKEYSIED